MHAYLNRRLLDVAGGRLSRLIVSAPPRHGKSELISRYFPAWYLGVFPDRRVVLVSYSASLAESWGRKVRDLLEEFGGRLFDVRVRGDVRSASEFELVGRAGGMLTSGVGGPLIGRGADLIIIDDPIKNQMEAQSAVIREHLWDWYETTLRTRLEPNGAMVLMQTRWRYDDLPGRLLRQRTGDRWEEIALRAIAEDDDPLGRALGEALWPERWPREMLLETKASSQAETWEALYQQRPMRLEGGTFKHRWFAYYDDMPTDGTTFLTVDLAASLRETADYTVIAVWRFAPDGRLYLLGLERARMEGPDIVPSIARKLECWKASTAWIERAGFQLALVQEARRAGLPVRELVADRDKLARALVATAWFEAGRILFPRQADFLPALEAELCSFPRGAHDDQVDALSYAALVARDLMTDGVPTVLPFEPLPYTPYSAVELVPPPGW